MFKKDDKVIYNEAKDSVHHLGTIVEVTDNYLKVEFRIGTFGFTYITFPLNGYDKTFKRQLELVESD